jgi:hypothetical protein
MTTLPTNYTNDTASFDLHPDAHNDTNAAVNTLQTDVSALTARLTALEASQRVRIGPPGRWVWGNEPQGRGTAALVAQKGYLTRFTSDQAFDQLKMEVTVAVAASKLTVGIYRVDAQGLPTTVAAQQSLDSATTGDKLLTFTALAAGIYWAASLPSHAITVRTCGEAEKTLVTSSTTGNVGGTWAGWQTVGTLTSLPDPFVQGTWGTAAAPFPHFLLRLA